MTPHPIVRRSIKCVRSLLTVLLGVWLIGGGSAHAENRAGPDVAALFRQLGDDEPQLRLQAQRLLIELGLEAVPSIERRAAEAGIDELARLVAILERMFRHECFPVADEAERALDRLSRSERPEVAARAEMVLAAHQELRERRAVAALRELGADVLYEPVDLALRAALLMRPAWPAVPSELVIPGQDAVRIQVWLHHDMTGGEEALWHIERLAHHWNVRAWGLSVYQIQGNGISSAAVHSLVARIPQANIQERGAVCLGISCAQDFGCQIREVLPGGSAHAAGVRMGDEVLELDGVRVPTFSHLVARLMDYELGDEVQLTLWRHGRLATVDVTLGSWRSVADAAQQRLEPPEAAPRP